MPTESGSIAPDADTLLEPGAWSLEPGAWSLEPEARCGCERRRGERHATDRSIPCVSNRAVDVVLAAIDTPEGRHTRRGAMRYIRTHVRED